MVFSKNYFFRKVIQYAGIFIFILMVNTSSLVAQDTKSEWKMIWNDEFNRDGAPNPEKWGFPGRKQSDWNCYCADNLSTTFVKDGKLHLQGIINKQAIDTAKYQTACIQTKDKFSFKYGKIEVKAKLSKGKGSWPAIWLMPQNPQYGGWPDSGEIDIMEHLNNDSIVYQTLHSNYIDKMRRKENPVYFNVSPFKEDEYNTFGIEWYPNRIDFFVNHKKTFSYPKVENAGDAQWPFDQEFYIILDQALGGAWVGNINDKDLPVQMIVDWVRVYKNNSNKIPNVR